MLSRSCKQEVETPLKEVSADDITLFTTGGCHILAREIEKIAGWPIHCFLESSGWHDPCHHAFVVPREGWRLDIEGCSQDHMHDRRWGGWNGIEHEEFAYQEIVDAWNSPLNARDEAHAVSRALELAPLLVALATEEAQVLPLRADSGTLVS